MLNPFYKFTNKNISDKIKKETLKRERNFETVTRRKVTNYSVVKLK